MDGCFVGKVVIHVGFLIVYPLLLAQQTLSNDLVVQLMKAGFSEDLIITLINRSQGSYDVSVDGLIALKNAGVSNKEIWAIVAKAYPQPPAALVGMYRVASRWR